MTAMPSNLRFDAWVIRMTINKLYAEHGFESTREGARFFAMNKDTLDRILTGKVKRHDPTRIHGMAKLLGASDMVAEQLFKLAVQTHDNDASGYQNSGKPGIPLGGSPYAIVEAAANRLDIYEDNLITGLLQTVEYIRTLMHTNPFIRTETEKETIIQYKLDRQRAAFEEGDPPEMRVVLNENALKQISHLPCYDEQIAHLQKMIDHYNIGVYVFPTACGPCPAETGSFTLMGFDRPVTFETAFFDAYTGGTWVEDQTSIVHLRNLFKVILKKCVDLGAYIDADK